MDAIERVDIEIIYDLGVAAYSGCNHKIVEIKTISGKVGEHLADCRKDPEVAASFAPCVFGICCKRDFNHYKTSLILSLSSSIPKGLPSYLRILASTTIP